MSTSRPSELLAAISRQREEIRRLQRRIGRLETVCWEAQRATIWDFSIYGQLPDAGWVAIDRDAVGAILRAMEGVDTWHPWRTPIERRVR